VVAVLFVSIALITYSLRVYVRVFLISKWGLDDWLCTCAMVAFVVYSGCQIAGIIYGIGRHLNELSTENARRALMFWWLCEIFYIPSTIFLKLSVGVFLHRLAIKELHIWIIRFMTAASGLFGTAYLLLAIFQCRPINAWWIQKHAPPESKDYGWCFTNTTVVAVTFVSCSLNAVADCTFGLIPIFMVKDLRMPRKQKALVACILGFANIACVATIVRTPFTIRFYKDNDFLYETRTFALLSTIEPGVGIAACCIATLRPLLQQLVGNSSSGWFSAPHGNGRSGKKSYTISPCPPMFPTDHSSNYMEISAAWLPPSRRKTPTITGKEMKALYAQSELDDGRSITQASISDANGGVINVHFPMKESQRLDTETIRTDKTVGFTFFDDTEEAYEESLRLSRRSLPPKPVAHAKTASEPEKERSRRHSHAPSAQTYNRSHRYNHSTGSKPPGAVGDPFGAWR